MAKLNEKKVKWIIREMEKGEPVSRIASIQKVTRQWVNELYRRYRETGKIPVLGKPGRPASPPSEDVVDLVLRYHEMYGMGACGVELAMERDGIHVPHNRMHAILKSRGLARDEPKKQRRRRYVRYERPHSMDLWHADWYQHLNDEWWLVYEDDASRLVTGVAVDRTPTMDVSMHAFDSAVAAWGPPVQLLSDHGSVFWANPYDTVVRGPSRFTVHLGELGVEHILSRVGRPEGNGKVERVFQTLERICGRFGSLNLAAQWYNESWPHSSLDGRAPLHDFYWKLRPERIFGLVDSWFWEGYL
jgi:putative transposase